MAHRRPGAFPVVTTEFAKGSAEFSPAGTWIAFDSNDAEQEAPITVITNWMNKLRR